MDDKKYKFGFYRKTSEIPGDWKCSDYLINNNQIKLSRSSFYPLVPLTAKKNIMIRYVLYACLNLDNSGQKKFNFIQILNNINQNKKTYDSLIKKKIKRITEVSETGKFNRDKGYFKSIDKSKEELVQKKVIKKSIQYDKNAKILKDDIYYSLGLLLGNFLELKYVINAKDPEKFEDKKPNEKYYYLSSDGKKLSQKFYDENYLI